MDLFISVFPSLLEDEAEAEARPRLTAVLR